MPENFETPVPNQPFDDESSIDFTELFAVIWRARKKIFLFVVAEKDRRRRGKLE